MRTAIRRILSAISEWQDHDDFLLPVATLVSGTTAAYALSYAARPVITRLFTAEAFGLLTFFVALLTIITTVSSGRYGDAIMLPETAGGAANVAALSGGLVMFTSAVITMALPWRLEIARFFGQPDLAPWLFLLPPVVLAGGWTHLAETWYTRADEFKIISAGRLVRSAGTAGLQIAGGWAGYTTGALIGGHVAGSIAAAFFVVGVVAYRHGRLFRSAVRWPAVTGMAVRYRRFLTYSAPAALLNNAVSRLPVILLMYFYASDIVGYYGVAYGTLAVPLSLITGAVGQVFFVRAAAAKRENTLPTMTANVYRRLVAVGLFPAAAVVTAGPTLFTFVFGPDWTSAGIYARYLAPWIFLASIASPLTRLFDVLERQRADLTFSLGMFVVVTAALVVGGMTSSPLKTLMWFGAVGAGTRLVHIALMLRLSRLPRPYIVRPFGRYLLVSVPFIAAIMAADRFTDGGITFGLTCAAGLGYLLTVLRDDIRKVRGTR